MRVLWATGRGSLLMGLMFGALSGCGLIGCDRGGKPGQLEKMAPVFTVTDGQRTVDLAKLRGKVVVLNFWASWCAPCTEEEPSLAMMQKLLPGVTVLAVSTDDDTSAYQMFLVQHHVEYLTVQDATQASNGLYGTHAYPETYIIDKQGFIRRKLVGPQDFTSPEIVGQLKKLMAQ